MDATFAIRINDAGICVADRSGVCVTEPGYVLVDGDRLLTGHTAFEQARIKPRHASNSHWSALSTDKGSASIAGFRSTAELAFAQLDEIWGRFKDAAQDVVLVVPSNYVGAQLGLLLGLAQQAGMPVRAMVDAAVAASARPYPGRQLLYVDAGLHGVTVTPLEQDDEVTASECQSLDSMGLAALMDAFARRIAEIFVLSSRFDPLHQATTEQLLYTGLPEWLERLRADEVTEVSIPFGDETFSIDLERGHLLGAAQGFYRALLQLIAQTRQGGTGLAVQLSDRLARLPGIAAELRRLDDAVIVELEHGAAATGVLAVRDALLTGGADVKLFRHLPWRAEPDPHASAVEATAGVPVHVPAGPTPTHLVYRGVAYRVNGEGIVIGRSKSDNRVSIVLDDETRGVSRSHCEVSLVNGELRLRDLSSFGTFVNERRVAGDETLRPADVIRIGSPGAELMVIAVENDDGT